MTLLAGRFSAVVAVGVVLGIPAACAHDAWIGAELPSRDASAPKPDATVKKPDATVKKPDATVKKPDTGACHPVSCGKRGPLACGDCKDNDDDGLVDMKDPECLGPCQDSEVTFANPMPGQGHGSCVLDCYFDGDNGVGNDDCEWSHTCDSLSVAPDYPPEGIACAFDPNGKLPRGESCASAMTAQSEKCKTVCGPLIPNGCDCFGCCSVDGVTIFLGSVDDQGVPSCDLEHAKDPARCKSCTQVQGCLNACDLCEVCVGKRTVDPSCSGGGTSCAPPKCGPTQQPCGLDCLPECPAGYSCITGCCTEPPR